MKKSEKRIIPNYFRKISNYFKINTRQIALMSILLATYLVIKCVVHYIFVGPLNFSVELLFWIFNGIIFGPIIGSLFSILCDTIFAFFTSGIAFWMIEYAIIPPLVSIISWVFLKFYKENKYSIIISIATIIFTILMVLIVFFYQLISKNFYFENISKDKILPIFIYVLICLFCSITIIYSSYLIIQFKKTKQWTYIKKMYIMSVIFLITVLFRWLWGPFAFIRYMQIFINPSIDTQKQFILTLFGIVMKSCISLPIATLIATPTIKILDRLKLNESFI